MADQQGVDLAVFPESYLQGHSYSQSLIERRAASLESPAVREVLDGLTGVRATAIIGLFERRGEVIFNSAMVIQRGRLAGVYSKAFPLEDGCSLELNIPSGKKGIGTSGSISATTQIIPKPPQPLTKQGAKLICVPINNMLRPGKAEIWRVRAVPGNR